MKPEKKTDVGLDRRGFLKTGVAGTLGGLALMNLPRILRADTFPGPVIFPEMDPRSIRICYNENPLGPSADAITAMQNEASQAHLYGSWWNSTLRGALATEYGLSTGNFIFGAGASEILHLVADAYLSPGDELIWADPSYGQMATEAWNRGATVVEVPLTPDYKHDLAAMVAAVTGNTKVIIITNPSNPTGTLIDPTDFHTLMAQIPTNILVVMDQAYYEYLSDPSYPDFAEYITADRPYLIIRTFSKIFALAGARAGYGVSTEAVINQLAPFKILASLCRATEAGCVAALDDSQHSLDTVTLNNQTKQFLYDEFTRMGLAYIATETNFVMVDVVEDAAAVRSQLSSRGIYVRQGWGMPTWLRVSTGTMSDMISFVNALEDILFGTPYPIRDLTIERVGADARLRWQTPGEVDWYTIYRNLQSQFEPTPADSIGWTTDTTWVDPGVGNNPNSYFYRVKSTRNNR